MTTAIRFSVLVVLGSSLVACSPTERNGADDDGDDDTTVMADASVADANVPVFIDAAPLVPDSDLPEPDPDGVVYGHSSSMLYQVDPETYAVTPIAPFAWPKGGFDTMTDIAVDKNGLMMGVSFNKAYRIDPLNAVCTFVGTLDHQFNGLSFVPADASDPTGVERLVGTTLDGSVWSIDPATGVTTLVGNYGGGWTSSGDIVYVEGFGIVATVKAGGFGTDFLASIDPTSFAATVADPAGTGTGFSDIWGLGYWKGKVFGFSGASQMLLVDPQTGVAQLLQSGSNIVWWGAGVTTAAPIID